ncbi:MAG: hypothetical protein IMZ62_01840 [Chloroflexi bacterium]|nr:hypothetical protein [Chloroflexota bacterium]
MGGIDRLIEKYESRAERTRKARSLVVELKEILGDDRDLVREVVDTLLEEEPGAAVSRPETDRGKVGSARPTTHAEKICAVFRSRSNTWLTVKELASALGVERNTFASVLYAKGGLFEQRHHPSRPKLRQWRIAPSAQQGGDLPRLDTGEPRRVQ